MNLPIRGGGKVIRSPFIWLGTFQPRFFSASLCRPLGHSPSSPQRPATSCPSLHSQWLPPLFKFIEGAVLREKGREGKESSQTNETSCPPFCCLGPFKVVFQDAPSSTHWTPARLSSLYLDSKPTANPGHELFLSGLLGPASLA